MCVKEYMNGWCDGCQGCGGAEGDLMMTFSDRDGKDLLWYLDKTLWWSKPTNKGIKKKEPSFLQGQRIYTSTFYDQSFTKEFFVVIFMRRSELSFLGFPSQVCFSTSLKFNSKTKVKQS